MHSESGYVIRDKDGLYFCGLNAWDKQLRKAKIYTSLKMAHKFVIDSKFMNRGCKAHPVKVVVDTSIEY